MKELDYPFDSNSLLINKKRLRRVLLDQSKEFSQKKIAILSGSTVGELQDILELFLLNNSIQATFLQGNYHRYYEESVFENQALQEFSPDFIYLHLTNKNVLEIIDHGNNQSKYQLPSAEMIFDHFKEVLDALISRFPCSIIVNNFEPLPYRTLGNADVWHPFGELNLINEVNRLLYQYARDKDNLYINDLNYEAAYFGLEKWFDHTIWYLYKYPFSMEAIPWVSFNIANIIKAILGKNKKALVTDLDDTIWGGIIGEIGAEHIQLGPESPKGIAYQDFQKYLKKINRIGIALAICSKNEYDTAMTGLMHPAGVLKQEDFLIKKANWLPKSENISDIANELNILPDSIVFLDDNPAERELVRGTLPEVKVPELQNVEEYRTVLDKSGYFELVKLTQEDLQRNEYYKQNLFRKQVELKYNDYGDFLSALHMEAVFEAIDSRTIGRVTQLINKTNQFNLTTIRYTQEELDVFLKDPLNLGLCGSLIDKFGDNGIVTVLIGRIEGENFRIMNWIMSCRVFKRELEYALFDELLEFCRSNKINSLTGEYIPTLKNKIFEDFYKSLGFQWSRQKENVQIWEYIIPEQIYEKNKHIKRSRKVIEL